jgi:NAD(P)-dependent dehydrogenase (short-subunit alcohol dehydrogenase family)
MKDSAEPSLAAAANATVSTSSQAEPGARRFVGKTALITGVSDRGIGGAIAERLAEEGAAVAMISRHAPRKTLHRLKRLGQPAAFAECDVTRDNEVRRALDECVHEFGKIDVLVNNAGVEAAGRLDRQTDDEVREILDVNLHGAILVTRAALPCFVESGGVIVNIASALALGGCAGFAAYSASKAGLVGFTQSLAWELAPHIRVVAVAPGLVHTPMTHKHIGNLTPEAKRQIEASHPLGVGNRHDVASAVAFLASDEARWITGVTLPLGWTSAFPLPTGQFLGD